MSFAARPSDPLDTLRADLEQALAHLQRIRERVHRRELDGSALVAAELRYRHALDRWQAAVRGESA